jgi:hypothetical protein
MNRLFRRLRANFTLAIWTSQRVSPRAQRVARKRSPALDRRFGMTLHYRLATSRLKRKRRRRSTKVIDKAEPRGGGATHQALESKVGNNDEHVRDSA